VPDGPLDVSALALVAAYLEQHGATRCPRTAMPFLRMTAKDHVRLAFQMANARRAAAARARGA
jgi:hypothetical protein